MKEVPGEVLIFGLVMVGGFICYCLVRIVESRKEARAEAEAQREQERAANERRRIARARGRREAALIRSIESAARERASDI